MDADLFVQRIVEIVHSASVRDVLATLEKGPAGRGAHSAERELSAWYNSLAAEDRDRIEKIIERAVHSSLFGVFCVLDGVRGIEDGPEKGDIELSFVKGSETVRLSEDLHDLYQARVYSRVFEDDA